MEFQDKMLKCIDCGADFVFTSGEQLFFHDKQFRNEPKRCKTCKAKRVAILGATNTGHPVRRGPRHERCVRSAAKRPRCRSDRRRDVPCCAGTVSSRGGQRRRRDLKPSSLGARQMENAGERG